MTWQERIVSNPDVLMGKPVIKGTRLSVGFLLDLLSQGWSEEQLTQNYPQLTTEDLRAVLAYSAARIKDEDVVLLKSSKAS